MAKTSLKLSRNRKRGDFAGEVSSLWRIRNNPITFKVYATWMLKTVEASAPLDFRADTQPYINQKT